MISAKSRARALDMLRAGNPQREIARRCKISKGAVSDLAKTLRAVPAAFMTDDADQKPEPGEVDALTASASEISREIAGQSLAVARLAKAEGNSTAATRALKSAREAANDLGRAERVKREGEERLFTREELDAAMRSNYDRVAKLAADLERTGGLCCAKCGAEVRLRLAQGGS